MRQTVSLLTIAALPLLVACGGSQADQPSGAAATTPPAAPTAAPAAEPAKPATQADSIGVPECDDYIAKYMACIGDHVPEAARAQYKAAFDQAVVAWRQAAATPEGRSSLATACSQAQAAAAQAMTAYGCSF